MCISVPKNFTAHWKMTLVNASGGHSDTEHIINGGYVVGGVDTIKTNKIAEEAEIWRERV